MIKELRVDYRKCFTNSALSSTAKRFSPSTRQTNLTGFVRRRNQFNPSIVIWYSSLSRGRDRPCERPPARIRT